MTPKPHPVPWLAASLFFGGAQLAGSGHPVFPQWIQGHHAPIGNVAALAGLEVKDRGRALDWRRDACNPFAFHIVAPPGATRLEITFDYLGAASKAQGYTFSSSEMVRLRGRSP